MPALTLTIKDETTSGKVYNEVNITLAAEIVTVKEIITARVTSEVDTYNKRLPEYYNGLVQPTDAEKTLNGYRFKQKRKVDAEQQVYAALKAFNTNVYFLLIDNIQAESLEQMILVNSHTNISFIKLTPLVGG
jgi:hypothetical protein